jgi:hypothetical protein
VARKYSASRGKWPEVETTETGPSQFYANIFVCTDMKGEWNITTQQQAEVQMMQWSGFSL